MGAWAKTRTGLGWLMVTKRVAQQLSLRRRGPASRQVRDLSQRDAEGFAAMRRRS